MSARPSLGAVWALISGGLLALAYPKADLGVLAFVALVPFFLSLQNVRTLSAALGRGYACGIAFFGALLYWIPRVVIEYGGVPRPVAWLLLLLLVLYLAGFFALFALILAMSWKRFGVLALLTTPFVWVGIEIARGRLLGGFPWGLLGYSQYRNIELLQTSAWGGVYSMSFCVAAANAGIALLFARPAVRRQSLAGTALLAVVLLAHAGGVLVLRDARREPADQPAIPVAAIQPNVAQERKWDPQSAARILADLAALTREADGARLIVWPESSSPFSFRRPAPLGDAGFAIQTDATYLAVVADLARALRATLIVGSVDYAISGGRLRAFNSAFVLEPDGSLGPSYAKIHLVPFGEYVPLHRLLFFVDRMAQGAIADFATGTRPAPLPTTLGPVATSICYEAIFPEVVRLIAGRDSAFLVNITNDAWFGRSAAPAQHLAMAAVRAAENRRWLVRAANTGISAIVDPWGRIVERTPLMTRAVLRGAVRPRSGVTPYAVGGDVFAWGCVILTLLQCAALRAAFPRRAG